MKKFFNKLFLTIGLILFCLSGFAQDAIRLEIYQNEKIKINKLFADSISLTEFIANFQLNLSSLGYVQNYFDTINNSKNSLVLTSIKGEKFIWKNVKLGETIQTRNFTFLDSGGTLNSYQLQEGINKQLIFYENNGFPFSRIYFDSIKIEENGISAKIESILGDFVEIDSLVIKGESKTNPQFIWRYLGIKKGQTYNESLINKLDSRLRNIPFIELIRGSEVFFTKGKATVVLYIKDKSASRFDGILGINPDEATGRIAVVGDVKVNLLNAFKRGERLVLNWESVKENTQNYALKIDYPFLFGTRVGLLAGINYFRQDTTFANLNLKGGFSFFLENNQRVSITANVIQSNSLLSEANLNNQFQSLETVYLGVAYELNSLDYRLNPRKGWEVFVELNSGNKTIGGSGGSTIETEAGRPLKFFQIKSDVVLSYFIPVRKKSTIKIGGQAGNIFGESIFNNELYQIGGLNTIRGFNQQSFLVSNYAILSTEFRYLFDRNSALFGFVDAAFYESNSIANFITDTPFGFGAGVNFQTGAGIFTLTYGLGKQQGNPILIKNGKVHFGFVSLF